MGHADPLAGQRVDAGRLIGLNDVHSYTPELIATSTNPNLGASPTRVGSWHRQGHWVYGEFRIQFSASGVSAGSGTYLIVPPHPIDLSRVDDGAWGGASTAAGWGHIRDNSAAGNNIMVDIMIQAFNDVGYLWLQPPGLNAGVTHNSPFTWAASDQIMGNFAYPAEG